MNKKETIMIQSHFALVWWAESLLSGYFQGDFFKNEKFTDGFVHDQLMQQGIAAGALIAPTLYVALVLPRETIFEEYKSDFNEIDRFITDNIISVESSYPVQNLTKYTRHLRNATAHARISIIDGIFEFEDEDKRNSYQFKASINLSTLGCVVQKLQLLLRKHVNSLTTTESGEVPSKIRALLSP